MTSLPAIRAGLLSNELDGQKLIYDSHNDKIHLLDPTTARVFEMLQNGALTDVTYTGDALFNLAIQELRKAELLDESVSSSAVVTGINRREALRKIALTGAAAAIIPAIVTLSPRETSAQTLCLPKKACCLVDAECCSNKCDLSTGTGCTTGPLECH